MKRIKEITLAFDYLLAESLNLNELPFIVCRNSAGQRLRWGEAEFGHSNYVAVFCLRVDMDASAAWKQRRIPSHGEMHWHDYPIVLIFQSAGGVEVHTTGATYRYRRS
jgi:hypothetical protein